jgi:hypothetical protein
MWASVGDCGHGQSNKRWQARSGTGRRPGGHGPVPNRGELSPVLLNLARPKSKFQKNFQLIK